MNPTLDPIAREIRDAIVRELDPERIVLFGSHARGDARPDSDWDFLIIGELQAGESRRASLGRLYRALGHMGVGKDLLFYTPSEVEQWKAALNHVIAQALREGQVLYDRAS